MPQPSAAGNSLCLFTGRLAGNSLRAAVEPLELRVMLSTNWFVSPAGSDSNPGTISAPFQTIEHAAWAAQPGDVVQIRAGIYHETVTPPRSGQSWAPITFQAYNNESVTIDGADPVNNWGGGNGTGYHALMPWDLGEGNNQVFVDGRMILEARWPNTPSLDLSNQVFAHAQGATNSGSTTTIYDSALTQPTGYWWGAIIHFAPGQGWVGYAATVVASGPGYVTFNYQPSSTWEAAAAGNSYYLFGKPQAIDSAGEWYRDPVNGQLMVWPPAGDSPAAHLVEAKHRLYAFDLSGVSNITVRGLNIFAATINTDQNSSNIVLDHLSAKYLSASVVQWDGWNPSRNSGIVLNGNNDLLENSEIAYSPGDGVLVGGSGDRVSNNLIHDVDYNGTDSAGIRVYGPWSTIDHNTIYNTGRDGVGQFGWSTHIGFNTIHDALLQTTDGGGIYTIRSWGTGAEIAYNRVYNIHSSGFGGVGIYLDDDSSNYLVHHNITWNVDDGMKLNSSSKNEQIYNNTLDATQFSIGKNWGTGDWSGSLIANNIFTHSIQWGSINATWQNNINPGTDPGFTNPWRGDLSLQWYSPAINAGMVIAPYTNGYTGSMPDDGALEFGAPAFASGASVTGLPTPAVWQLPTVASPVPTPAPAPGPFATSTFRALNYDAASKGVAPSFGGVGYLLNGSWVAYRNVNFGAGVSTLQMDIAVPAPFNGKKLEVHIDGINGPMIGSIIAQPSSSWGDYKVQSTAISPVTGVHDLYFVIVGDWGFGNIDWFKFT